MGYIVSITIISGEFISGKSSTAVKNVSMPGDVKVGCAGECKILGGTGGNSA